MNPTETFPHRRDDPDRQADCRCGAMAVHDPKLGETWGRNCPAALRERVAELESQALHPLWLPSAADAVDLEMDADASSVLAGIRAVVKDRDTLRARVAELEATVANERGEGEPPSEGWEWVGSCWANREMMQHVSRLDVRGWRRVQEDETYGPIERGWYDTARAAMIASDAARSAGGGGS